MKLCYEGLQDRAAWEKAGIKLPEFDWKSVCEATDANPTWVHFGGGNIFRGFVAKLQQDLLNQGLVHEGIYAVSGRSNEANEKVYQPHDSMTLLVSLLPDGSLEKEVVASIVEGLCANPDFPQDVEKLKTIFRSPSLQMVSYTITEKGYALADLTGAFSPAAQADFQNGPDKCTHTMSLTAALLLERFRAGGAPVALVSMDNCSRNGDKLRESVLAVAEHWRENGFVPEEFLAWLRDEKQVAFPWTMIDKITPRPAKSVEDALAADGVEDMAPIVTGKNTYIAPFVNAEKPQYLVIEDHFPNGRPPLEKAGVYLTDRETVGKTEKMKVMTCLNPLHTALAVYGCLLGYQSIAAEMRDADLKALVEKIGLVEGMPVVVDPKILNPRDFIREVIDIRFPNPFIPDAPQRIATDTSQKVGIRFGETIRAYAEREDLDVTKLTFIPLAIAGWLRYLLGVDDAGAPMACSSDPLLEELQAQLEGVTLGQPESLGNKLDKILANRVIFASDLISLGLGGKITDMVREMLAGPGAVRNTLHKYLI